MLCLSVQAQSEPSETVSQAKACLLRCALGYFSSAAKRVTNPSVFLKSRLNSVSFGLDNLGYTLVKKNNKRKLFEHEHIYRGTHIGMYIYTLLRLILTSLASCPYHPSAGVTGMRHHTHTVYVVMGLRASALSMPGKCASHQPAPPAPTYAHINDKLSYITSLWSLKHFGISV